MSFSPIPPAASSAVRIGDKLVFQPSAEKSFLGTVVSIPERSGLLHDGPWEVELDFGEEIGGDIVPLRNCYYQI